MTTWTDLSEPSPGDRATAAWAQGVVTNGLYLHETAWHPYDMASPNDGADGLLYYQATSGAVASIVTPDFEDGYEYRLAIFNLGHSSGSSQTFRVSLYAESSAAYQTAVAMTGSVASATRIHGFIDLPVVRALKSYQLIQNQMNGATVLTEISAMPSAQKVTKAKLDYSGGNIDNGTVYLFRRRSFYS